MPRSHQSSFSYDPAAVKTEQGRIELSGVSVVAALAPAASPYEFSFASPQHAVVFSLRGSRAHGETKLDGTPACRSLVFSNTCLVIPAGAALSGWSSPRDVHEYATMTFDPALVSNVEGRLAHTTLRPELCFEDRLLSATASALQSEAVGDTDFGRLWTDALTNLVITRLLTRNAGLRTEAPPARGGLGPFQLRRVTEYMQDHLSEHASLAELAGLAGLSVSHFSRAFRASTGIPPHLWLRRRRIERAQDLLRTSAKPISEVAEVCGFSDQSHLTKTFHAQIGITPLQWRRSAF